MADVVMTKEQFDVLYAAYCELYEAIWVMDNSNLTTQLIDVDEDVNKVLKELEPQIGSGYINPEN